MLLSFCGSQCCFCFACSLMISQLVVWDFWHPLQKALCVFFKIKSLHLGFILLSLHFGYLAHVVSRMVLFLFIKF